MLAAELLIPIIESVNDNVESRAARKKIYEDIIEISADLEIEDLIECQGANGEFDKLLEQNLDS